MAVLESPEKHFAATEATISTSSSADLNASIRRRSTVTDSVSAEAESIEDLNTNADQDKDMVKIENRSDIKFTYRPSVPAHRGVKESPLSSDAIFKQSHAGLFNLCIVVLVAVNSRLIIENLIKYGWLINSGFWFSSKSLSDWPLFMCCLTLPAFSLTAYLVEKLAYRKYLSEPVVVSLHIIITSASLFYPFSVILRCDSAFFIWCHINALCLHCVVEIGILCTYKL